MLVREHLNGEFQRFILACF